MRKKIISLLLCLVMMFSLGATAFAAQPGYKTVTDTYSYCPALGFLDFVSNQTGTFTYSDEYFTHSGYEYNHALAIMTMVMTQTSFASATSASDGWNTANRNFNDLMTKCGFKNLAANADAVNHPGGETIGAYAASKKINDDGKNYTLIAVGVRGHNYGGEWYSNFDMGVTGDHKGFADARDKVLSFIKDYVADNKITGPVKIWITGYSRGAITANMVGGYLDQGYKLGNGVSLNPSDLYCYTFETPAGVSDTHAHDALYGNIHNILNHNDFVPMVSFEKWGHVRYGIDYYLPCRQYDACYSELKPQVNAMLNKMGWMNILGLPLNTIDDFHYLSLNPATMVAKKDVTQIEYFPEAINALFDTMAPSRQYYVDNLQADIQELSKTLLGVDTNRLLEAIALFGQKFVSLDNLKDMLSSLTITGAMANGSLVDVTVDLFMEAMQEAQCADYNGDQVRAMLKNLVPKLLTFVAKHPDTALTLLGNLVQILNAHFPEIGLSWMSVTPAYFFEEQNHSFVNGICEYNGDKMQDLYNDVPAGFWSYDAIKWAANHGIASGYDANTFAPDDPCTRAQTVSFLWRAAGCPEPQTSSCPFVDVAKTSPHYKAILWAAEKKITAGVDETHFAPNQPCTRGQVVAFLWRYEGRPAVSASNPFIDVPSTSPFCTAINWAADKGIAKGVDRNHFAPSNTCTRAHIISFIYRDMK